MLIFGQSGGGAKTSAVLGMPGAQGLFSAAAVQSGSALKGLEPEEGARLADNLVAKLGLSKGDWAKIQTIPWQQLVAAQSELLGGMAFRPVVGPDGFPHHPFDPIAPAESAQVPIIVGTTLEDAALALTDFRLDEAGLRAKLDRRYGGNADAIMELYRRSAPDASPYLLLAQITTDSGFRRGACAQAERKATQGGAPAYYYEWDWPTPAYAGRYGAVHGIDVSASMHNVRDGFLVGLPEARRLADEFAGAFVALARTGSPNHDHLPEWAPYDTESRPTMVFDSDTRLEADWRGEIRQFWADTPVPEMGMG